MSYFVPWENLGVIGVIVMVVLLGVGGATWKGVSWLGKRLLGEEGLITCLMTRAAEENSRTHETMRTTLGEVSSRSREQFAMCQGNIAGIHHVSAQIDKVPAAAVEVCRAWRVWADTFPEAAQRKQLHDHIDEIERIMRGES